MARRTLIVLNTLCPVKWSENVSSYMVGVIVARVSLSWFKVYPSTPPSILHSPDASCDESLVNSVVIDMNGSMMEDGGANDVATSDGIVARSIGDDATSDGNNGDDQGGKAKGKGSED